MAETACPMCRSASLCPGQGRLDQSGDSYLPTAIWSCACCGYVRYEPAVGERWRPAAEPAVALAPPPAASAAEAARRAA